MFTSCDKVCDVAKKGADSISSVLASRWECDKSSLYDFVVKPIESVVCKKDDSESKLLILGGFGSMICPIAAKAIISLGSSTIVSKFSCNKNKVEKDLTNVEYLCEILRE